MQLAGRAARRIESARRYADAVFDISGWGNPFSDAGEDGNQDESVGEGIGGNGEVVRVEARYRLLVKNRWEARRLLESRTRIRGEVLSEDLDDDSASGHRHGALPIGFLGSVHLSVRRDRCRRSRMVMRTGARSQIALFNLRLFTVCR